MNKFLLFIVLFFLNASTALGAGFDTPQIINPEKLYDPAPYGYSHVVISGDTAFIAGQGGENSDGQLLKGFENQVKQAYLNLDIALKSLKASPQQVVKLNTYVVGYDQSKLITMTKYLNQTFKGWLPAQTLVPVPRLAIDGMLFEVDAVVNLANKK